tara:strand:+ start:22473 stop:22778 length:306 start_codon:yes stop_codon:yes gene_type:complete
MQLYLLSETFEGLPVNYFCSLKKELLTDLIVEEQESNTDINIQKIDSDIDQQFIKDAKLLTDKGIQICLNFIVKNNKPFLTKKKLNQLDIFNLTPIEFCSE